MNESASSKHLNCDYCKYPLIDSMLLWCHHKLCAAYIENESESSQVCPNCRQPTERLTLIVECTLLDRLNSLLDKWKKCAELCRKQEEKINEFQNQLMKLYKNYRAIIEKRFEKSTGMATKHVCAVETKYSHRYSDVIHVSQNTSEPISRYENTALISLEDAVEPLTSLVEGIKQMASTVKEICKESIDNLLLDESASIMLYSMEVEPRENSLYCILNKTLQDEDQQELEHWFLYLRLFVTSLSKLPLIQEQIIYRGATTDLSDQYPIGTKVVWSEFVSCTQSIEILEQFLGKSEIRTLFEIKCRSGKEIRHHSCFHREDAILLPAGIKFQVISNDKSSPDLHIIQLKEISRNWDLEQKIAAAQPRSWINLASRQLVDQDMHIVAEQAIIEKQCTELDLGSNRITSQGASIIGNALCSSTTIRRLYLGDNQVADNGAEHLALSVENSTLFVLGLSKNGITDEGAQYLGEMLKTNRRLTVLGLEDNEISDRGLEELVNALKHNNKLIRLLLARNKMISGSSVTCLGSMLQRNRALKRLDLHDCNLSDLAKAKLQQMAIEKGRNFELLK